MYVYKLLKRFPISVEFLNFVVMNLADGPTTMKIKRLIKMVMIVLLTMSAFGMKSQTSMDSTAIIRCVSVLPNGHVALTWTQPLDTIGVFNEYIIYSSGALYGTYIAIVTNTSYAATSATDVFINANTQNEFYYMRIMSINAHGDTLYSPCSDTVETILLNLTTPTGFADLSWNAISNPALTSTAAKYKIYREYPTGVWTLIDSTTGMTYQQPVVFCHQMIAYRVEVSDSSGCISSSNADSAYFQYNHPPQKVEIDSVSIDSLTGNIIIGWTPDTALNIGGYIILRRLNGVTSPIHNIVGKDSSFYDTHLPLGGSVDSFLVLAYDSCGNLSSPGYIQRTINLKGNIDTCDLSVVLTWNSYEGWIPGVRKYDILMRTDSGPYVIIDSVSATTNTYSYHHLSQLHTYDFKIRAFHQTLPYTSTSNALKVDIVLHHFPHFAYIKTATVINDHEIRVDIHSDSTAQVIKYLIQRSTDTLNSTFETIATTSKYIHPDFSYFDYTPDANTTSYYYRYQVYDSCNLLILTSNLAKTILLKASANPDMTNTVTWTSYSGFNAGDSSFFLYRSIDGVMSSQPIATLSNTRHTFIDSIQLYIYNQGEFCYHIIQMENSCNVYGFIDSSSSNTACADQAPLFFIPNAFTPNGRNPIFLPITTFADIHLYTFQIFDRAGNMLFETTDIRQGWDGTYKNGVVVPMGVYIWSVNLIGTNELLIKQMGAVTLLK